eukprot:424403-Hanusia_phi.AAC.1
MGRRGVEGGEQRSVRRLLIRWGGSEEERGERTRRKRRRKRGTERTKGGGAGAGAGAGARAGAGAGVGTQSSSGIREGQQDEVVLHQLQAPSRCDSRDSSLPRGRGSESAPTLALLSRPPSPRPSLLLLPCPASSSSLPPPPLSVLHP